MAADIGQMFYVGALPWHGQGQKFAAPLRAEEALKAGGLDYRVELAPIVLAGEPTTPVPHRRAVVRTDRAPGAEGRVLGAVHPGFKLLQNDEGARLFDRLAGQGQPVYTTGGYLGAGAVVWLQARLPKDIWVGKDDQLESYLLFCNSHDGSFAITIRFTTIRVVCRNTLTQAVRDRGKGPLFRRGHGDSPALLEQQIASFAEAVEAERSNLDATLNRLHTASLDSAKFKAFLEKLLPFPALPATARGDARVRHVHEARLAKVEADRKAIARVMEHGHKPAADGPSTMALRPEEGTWWGALNAVTGWVDHVQATPSDRFAHAMFGQGDALKQQALRLAVETVAA
jgi:phage/plasmid-like protein (TIGR03299 family)